MSINNELETLLDSFDPANDNPITHWSKCVSLIDNACSVGEQWDPRELPNAQAASDAYNRVAVSFFQKGYHAVAESTLIDAWNKFASIQSDNNHRVYRAAIAIYLSHIYLWLGDKGAALRWALYTQADDVLGQHGEGGGQGRNELLGIHSMSGKALREYNDAAKSNLALTQEGGQWNAPHAFAEDVLVQFINKHSAYAPLFASTSSRHEYPLTPAYFSALNNLVKSAETISTGKGDNLERLAAYLFLLIPGWLPSSKMIKDTETDIVVRNLNPTNSVLAELFGRYFLVECKNWNRPVDVSAVGYFLYRMRLSHAKIGVVFASQGITGSDREDGKAARQLIERAFQEDNSICIVIDQSDLDGLERGQDTFLSLLLERSESRRFGRSRGRK